MTQVVDQQEGRMAGELGATHLVAAAALGAGAALVALRLGGMLRVGGTRFSVADQKKRFELAKRTGNQRVLDIDTVFKDEKLRGKRVLVVGGNRGLGLELVKQLQSCGATPVATTRSASKALDHQQCNVIGGVDVQVDADAEKLAREMEPVDVVITNAGYFYGPVERISENSLNFDEELKMIDICGVGPLRIVSAIVKAGKLRPGGKVALITSQAGSVAWREVQNPHGDNYGHHMSRAATNMMGRLLSFELREQGFAVAMLHPGFNRTKMTEKYKEIWDEEGAVDPAVGAKRVLHEINELTLERTGRFVNCEDSLDIPW